MQIQKNVTVRGTEQNVSDQEWATSICPMEKTSCEQLRHLEDTIVDLINVAYSFKMISHYHEV